ncbi:MAG: adenylate/guanylate cyclase domain-containing protein [Vampirovibrionales bacterium]
MLTSLSQAFGIFRVPFRQGLQRYGVWYLAVALMALLLIESTGALSQMFNHIELWHFSQRQRSIQETRRQANIVIVGLDDYTLTSPTLKGLFGRYPFRRDVYAHVIDYFSRAQAKVLIFDMAFNGGDDLEHPEADRALVRAANQSSIPVASGVLATQSHQGTLANTQHSERQILYHPPINITGQQRQWPFSVANTLMLPNASLRHGNMQFVPTNGAGIDTTNTVRYANLFTATQTQATVQDVYPTLPLATFLALSPQATIHLNAPRSTLTLNHQTPIPLHRRAIIRWYGDNRGATNLSLNGEALTTQSSVWDPSKTLGPIGQWVLKQGQQWGIFSTQRIVHVRKVYPQISLWDVLYSQLYDSCPQQARQALQPNQAVCQEFLRLSAQHPLNPKTFRSDLGQYLSPHWFKNQHILLGTAYENAPGDIHHTIYGGVNYHGVYINANILDNLIHREFVWQPPQWVTTALIIGFSALLGFTAFYRPIGYCLILAIALVGGYSVFTFWLYQHHNGWINWTLPTSAVAFTFMISFAIRTWLSERRKQQLRFAFGKYVSADVMQTIEKNPTALKLGGQRAHLTILFTDIRGFTTFSENNDPQTVQNVLSDYFKVMHGIILSEYGGTINKLIGDAILAYWGFPLAATDDPLKAVSAALRMQQAMDDWNANPNHPPLAMGIGIHTGEVVVGNVGSDEFMDFTLIGDAVNLASRLESETKHQSEQRGEAVKIILSQATYQHVEHAVEARALGTVQVKGKHEAVAIYEPLRLSNPALTEQESL